MYRVCVNDSVSRGLCYSWKSDIERCYKRIYVKGSCNMELYSIIAGNAVAQLVEALRYKPEGRGFDSRWCHRNVSLI
jgi:hypothetical protein